ncbi:MAG: ribosome maturation factor RimM [Gemmatimonadales bacterium]
MSQPDRPRFLAVGRLRKPHGLKGEFAIFPLTAEPEAVFVPGRQLVRLGLDGAVLGEPIVVERSRGYHREWLVKFRGVEDRDLMGQWRGQFLGAPAEELTPLAEGEVYLHELEGFAVRGEDGTAYGLVSGLLELPTGITLEVQGPKREFLLPFIKEFVREVRREERLLVVVLPEGLLD